MASRLSMKGRGRKMVSSERGHPHLELAMEGARNEGENDPELGREAA
jgi:hypothetical protein